MGSVVYTGRGREGLCPHFFEGTMKGSFMTFQALRLEETENGTLSHTGSEEIKDFPLPLYDFNFSLSPTQRHV
ncbi:hypothetical protein GCM10027396_00110 [Insolitispirillum peregrinum]